MTENFVSVAQLVQHHTLAQLRCSHQGGWCVFALTEPDDQDSGCGGSYLSGWCRPKIDFIWCQECGLKCPIPARLTELIPELENDGSIRQLPHQRDYDYVRRLQWMTSIGTLSFTWLLPLWTAKQLWSHFLCSWTTIHDIQQLVLDYANIDCASIVPWSVKMEKDEGDNDKVCLYSIELEVPSKPTDSTRERSLSQIIFESDETDSEFGDADRGFSIFD